MTPTARSLAHLRELGFTAEVVERWIPGANIRRDLFGFIDILAIGNGEIVAVQTTSDSNVASRVQKITDHANLGPVRKAGIRIIVHGWRKAANGRWALREVDLS